MQPGSTQRFLHACTPRPCCRLLPVRHSTSSQSRHEETTSRTLIPTGLPKECLVMIRNVTPVPCQGIVDRTDSPVTPTSFTNPLQNVYFFLTNPGVLWIYSAYRPRMSPKFCGLRPKRMRERIRCELRILRKSPLAGSSLLSPLVHALGTLAMVERRAPLSLFIESLGNAKSENAAPHEPGVECCQ